MGVTFYKSDSKWDITYVINGIEHHWWHPLTIKQVPSGEIIEITEKILNRIFPSPEATESLVELLKQNPNGPYLNMG